MGIPDNCTSAVFAFDLRVESTAGPVILSRALQHWEQLELSEDQIKKLLRIARRYQDNWLRIATEFVDVSSQLDLVEEKPNLAQKRRLIARHARLLQDHEGLVLNAFQEIKEVLSVAQLRQLSRLQQGLRQEVIARLVPALQRSLAPSFTVSPAKRPRARRPKRGRGA